MCSVKASCAVLGGKIPYFMGGSVDQFMSVSFPVCQPTTIISISTQLSVEVGFTISVPLMTHLAFLSWCCLGVAEVVWYSVVI